MLKRKDKDADEEAEKNNDMNIGRPINCGAVLHAQRFVQKPT